MDARPEKFDAEFWITIAKLLSRLAVLAVIAVGGTEGAAMVADSTLKGEEAKAGTTGRVVDAKSETNTAYDEYGELARYYIEREAACDSALSSFNRHRDDDRDWIHVVEMCHSEGGFDEDPPR